MEGCSSSRVELPPTRRRSSDGLSGDSSVGVETCEEEQDLIPAVRSKRCLSNWTLAGWLLSIIVITGWLCLISLLDHKWQIIFMAWMLIYCAVHFSYWYCMGHSIFFFNKIEIDHIRIPAHLEGTSLIDFILSQKKDTPPSYDDVIDIEQPPPSYVIAVAQNQWFSKSGSMPSREIHQSKQKEANYSHQTPYTHFEDELSD